MQTKYCVKCGASNPHDAKYCFSCGAKMPDTEELAQPEKTDNDFAREEAESDISQSGSESPDQNESVKKEDTTAEDAQTDISAAEETAPEEKAEPSREEAKSDEEEAQSALPVHAKEEEPKLPAADVPEKSKTEEKHEESAGWRERLDNFTQSGKMAIASFLAFAAGAMALVFASPLKESMFKTDFMIAVHTVRSLTAFYGIFIITLACIAFASVIKQHLSHDTVSLVNGVLSIFGFVMALCASDAVVSANKIVEIEAKVISGYQLVNAMLLGELAKSMLTGYFFLLSAVFLTAVMCCFDVFMHYSGIKNT